MRRTQTALVASVREPARGQRPVAAPAPAPLRLCRPPPAAEHGPTSTHPGCRRAHPGRARGTPSRPLPLRRHGVSRWRSPAIPSAASPHPEASHAWCLRPLTLRPGAYAGEPGIAAFPPRAGRAPPARAAQPRPRRFRKARVPMGSTTATRCRPTARPAPGHWKTRSRPRSPPP